jgi:hypothetical protein
MGSQANGVMAVNGTINSIPAAPTGAKFYLHGMSDLPGVAAANNFLSIFNPVGSGKTVIFYQLILTPGTSGVTTVTTSMNIFRTTAASAGTLITASAVNRFLTADPNPVAQVRVGNPTVTAVGTTLLGLPPATNAAGVGGGMSANVAVPSGAGFVCLPGEGVVYSTAAGNVNQLWNLNVTWAEI